MNIQLIKNINNSFRPDANLEITTLKMGLIYFLVKFERSCIIYNDPIQTS